MKNKMGYFVTQATPKGWDGGEGRSFTGAIKVPEGYTSQDFYDVLKQNLFEPSSEINGLNNQQEMHKKTESVMKSKFKDGENKAWHDSCSKVKKKLKEMKWWTVEEFEDWKESNATLYDSNDGVQPPPTIDSSTPIGQKDEDQTLDSVAKGLESKSKEASCGVRNKAEPAGDESAGSAFVVASKIEGTATSLRIQAGVNGTIINIHNDDIRAALSNADGKDKAIVDTLLNVVPSISGQYMMLSEQNTKLSDLNLKLSDLNSKLADQNESLTSELVAAKKSIEQLSKDLMEANTFRINEQLNKAKEEEGTMIVLARKRGVDLASLITVVSNMETNIINSISKLPMRSVLNLQNAWARQVEKCKKPIFIYATSATSERIRGLRCFGNDMESLLSASLIVTTALEKSDFNDLFKAMMASKNWEKGDIVFFLEFSQNLDTGIEVCDGGRAEVVKMTVKIILDNLAKASSRIVVVCLPAPPRSGEVAKKVESALMDMDQKLSIIPLNLRPVKNAELSSLAIGLGKAILLLQEEGVEFSACKVCDLFCLSRCAAKKGYDESNQGNTTRPESSNGYLNEDDHKPKRFKSNDRVREVPKDSTCFMCGDSRDNHSPPGFCKPPEKLCAICDGRHYVKAHEVQSARSRDTMKKKWGSDFRFIR